MNRRVYYVWLPDPRNRDLKTPRHLTTNPNKFFFALCSRFFCHILFFGYFDHLPLLCVLVLMAWVLMPVHVPLVRAGVDGVAWVLMPVHVPLVRAGVVGMTWVLMPLPVLLGALVVLMAAVGDFAVRAGRAARSRRVRVALRVGRRPAASQGAAAGAHRGGWLPAAARRPRRRRKRKRRQRRRERRRERRQVDAACGRYGLFPHGPFENATSWALRVVACMYSYCRGEGSR
jgi:hypothetical protein